MKIALINPPVKRRYVAGINEPLHLTYLAAQLKELHELRLIDGFGESLSVEKTVAKICESEPDVVGISLTFTAAYDATLEICRSIKQHLPTAKTVVGGNTATFLASRLAKLPEIDVVVRGEGDQSFAALIQALAAKSPLESIAGLTYAQGTTLIETPSAPLVADLDSLPLPARDLLEHPSIYGMGVLGSRGCPYGCAYCSASAFWQRRTRFRKVDNVIEEIKRLLTDYHLQAFSFFDDCFTLNPRRASEFCRRINEVAPGIPWSCTGRIETCSPQLIKELGDAGCCAIFFGVESGSPKILKRLRRHYTADDVLSVYHSCLDNRIVPAFSFIVGLPDETARDLDATYTLIQKLKGVESGIHMLTPFPGTPIACDPLRFGLEVLPHDVSDLDINSRSYIRSDSLEPGEVEDAYRRAVGYACKSLRQMAAWN